MQTLREKNKWMRTENCDTPNSKHTKYPKPYQNGRKVFGTFGEIKSGNRKNVEHLFRFTSLY